MYFGQRLPPSAVADLILVRSMTAHRSICLCGALLVSGCGETVSWGYRNQLNHAVTVVEHGWARTQRIALARHQTIPSHWGKVPSSIELLGPDGRAFAHYRASEIPRIGSAKFPNIVVITPGRVYIQSED